MEQTPGAGVVTVNEPREDDSREIALVSPLNIITMTLEEPIKGSNR